MAYTQQPTTYLEKELMFKKKAEKMKCQIGNCKLNLVAPSQVILEVTEGGKVHNNYIKSVTMGTYDNMLCVESQDGVTFFLYENRQDRDEWYSTIRQLQHGHMPSFPTKRESLPAPPPVSTKPKGSQRKPVSSPSTLQQIFKQGLERDLNRILKRPQSNTGSGSYVNMDYNQALQDSKESYYTFNVLHGMQNMKLDPAPSEDTTYDIPDEEMSPNLIEDDIYEFVDDGSGLIEEQIYDDPFDEEFTEDTFYDDTEMGAGAFGGGPPGLPQWSTGETPPPLPRRPNTMLSPQSFNETDDIYETVESDLPPPIPARPQPATKQQMIGGNPNGRVALRPAKQSKSTPIKPSTKTTGKPMDVGKDGSRTHSTIGQSLGDELVRKVSQRNRSMTLPSGTGSHLHTFNSQDCDRGNTLSKKPMDLPSDIGKVQLRSPDRQMPKTRPSSDTDYPDELARKLAMRNSALSSDSTGSCLHGQTLHDQPTWKQPQDHDNQLPKPFPKKKALVPPPTPTKPGKAQPRDQVDTKKHKSLPPTPARKPVKPPPSQELYEDTEIGPPAPKPKPKNTKRSPVVGRVPLDVRITRHAMQSLAGSVTFRDESDFVVFPKHPPDVVHQKLYDGNPVSNHGTSSNPLRKIMTKRRTSVYRCPSILALVHTFLQMIIAVAIILAESPVLVAGSGSTERVTLQAGQPGVVPFHLQWSPSDTSQDVPFYTLRFESNPLPFCINGQNDIAGFKNPSQLRRFSTSVTDLDTSPCVNLMIDNVDTLDEDRYLLTVVWHSFENVKFETLKKDLVVHIPPGPAKCFITLSGNVDYIYEVHCEAITGSVTTTLSCYQNDRKIDIRGDITDNGLITRGRFWLHDYTRFSCCSHDVTLHVNETMCNDFEWPPFKETTGQIVNTVPTSVTTPIPQVESHTGSGACRQFMLPSLWHFTYLLVYILAFVTMY